VEVEAMIAELEVEFLTAVTPTLEDEEGKYKKTPIKKRSIKKSNPAKRCP
jgi:hypothetical protein